MPLRILITAGHEESDWIVSTARSRGHETASASTPAEAWRLLSGAPFDLILLDPGFPQGEPFADGMRRRKGHIPVVGLGQEPLLPENLWTEGAASEVKRGKLEALLQRYEERKNMVTQSSALASHSVEQRSLSRELGRANRRLTALSEAGRRMFSLESEERVFTELLRATAQFSRQAPSLILMARRQGLAVRMGLQVEPEQVAGITIPVADSAWKRTPSFRRLSDPTTDERVLSILGTDGYCTLPLRAGGKTYGLLIVGCGPEGLDRAAIANVAVTGATAVHARRRERQLRILAEQDGLTRLPNYKALQRILRLELKRHQRSGQPMTVAMLDIDFFKQVNDTHGHLTGDRTLRNLADLLLRQLRETDTVVRYGGEEFVMIMPLTPREGGEQKVSELLNTIRAIKFPKTGPLTLSAGLASYPTDGDSPQALLDAADHALYAAKREGRDRAVTYTEWLESSLASENDLSDDNLNGESPGDHP